MYAFIHIPKTAGTTLRGVLRRSFGARHCDIRVPPGSRERHRLVDASDLRLARRVYPQLAGICGHRVACHTGLERVAPEIRYFTFLREPRARLISHLRHAFRGKLAEVTREQVLSYCAQKHRRNRQVRMLCGREDLDAAIDALEHRLGFVGLTEAFDESFVLFRRWLGSDRLQPGYVAQRVSRHRTPLPLDDAELDALVGEANRLDTELYRHAVERVMARQRADYGAGLDDDVARLRELNAAYHDPGEPLSGRLVRGILYKLLLHLVRSRSSPGSAGI